MTHMTWRDLRNAIDSLGDDRLDMTACVALDDLHYMEYGTAGFWPIDGLAEWFGGLLGVTIDVEEEDYDEDEED